jgi:DNA repair protein RadD
MYTLRPYQHRAADAILSHVRTSTEPCLIDAATGAGKSLIIAETAHAIHKISGGKHILCLAPSAELVTQNREKYLMTGEPCSMFSASAGQRSLKHPVVFGTPGTVKNAISSFGAKFAAVVVDECHGITPTIKAIIDAIRECNANLRVIGLTATPYRLGEGYIYRINPDGTPCADGTIRDPYFLKCVDRITAHELIAQGYLTPPVIGAQLSESYDTSALRLNARHQFDSAAVDEAFVGHGRKTSAIVADVVEQARDRMGVMLFAATVKHAEEILASLPPHLSALVTGSTAKADRKSIIERFKRGVIKYLVNVSVLTTGFDAERVDVIALLRRTESVGLLQQIIGRGLRLHPDKRDCLVLDYAGNIENHCPDGDVFNPEIRAYPKSEGGGEVTCVCEICATENTFTGRPNEDEFEIDENGYFIDLLGKRIETDYGPMPAHFGRRCMGGDMVAGKWVQCNYRWTSKECPHCEAMNDIAARYCSTCKEKLLTQTGCLTYNSAR